MGFSSELEVGLFTLVGLAMLVFFLLSTRDAPFGPGASYNVYTVFPSAEGIQFGSMVQMAGVRVGRVGEITLTPDGKAQVILELNKEVRLPSDSKATVKTMGILGDRVVHLLPGTADAIIPPGGMVPYVPAGGDLDQLTQQAGDVTTEVKAIAEDIKAVTERLKLSTESGQGVLPVGLSDEQTRQITALLQGLNTFVARADRMVGGNDRRLAEIMANLVEVSRSLKTVVDANEKSLEGAGDQVKGQLDALQQATTRVNEALAGVNQIIGKVERGEGTVGKLLTDTSTVDTLNETISGANELLERVNRFETEVTYRGQFYALGEEAVVGGTKNTLAVTLRSRPDYYYTLELVSDPKLDSTLEVREISNNDNTVITRQERIFTDAWQFSVQFARRWHDLALRLGVKENHGGVGADYFLFRNRAALSLDLYDFSSRPLPNLELRARVGVYNRIYLAAGVDDLLNSSSDGSVNLYVGGGFSFTDPDLKYLLSFIPLP